MYDVFLILYLFRCFVSFLHFVFWLKCNVAMTLRIYEYSVPKIIMLVNVGMTQAVTTPIWKI